MRFDNIIGARVDELHSKGELLWGLHSEDGLAVAMIERESLLWREEGGYIVASVADGPPYKVLDGELSKVKSERRRGELIAVPALLNTLFEREVVLQHHPSGAPYLKDESGSLSISHCNKFIAVAYHPHHRVGVDVELINRDFSVVERRLLSERERLLLTDGERSTQLPLFWSAKEAIFKALPIEGVEFAKEIELQPFKIEESGSITVRTALATSTVHYKIMEEAVITWTLLHL